MALTNDEKLLKLRSVDGLDVDAGLKTLSGMTGAYIKVLGILVKMDNNDEGLFEKQLEENDIEAFRTSVHGYKSALANIGALTLSEAAKALEMAAKENDRGFIDANLTAFENGVGSLAAELKDILES